MDKEQAQTLLEKYNSGIASEEESILLENWYAQELHRQQADPLELDYPTLQLQMWKHISQRTDKRTVPIFGRIAAAASIIMAIGIGIYFYAERKSTGSQDAIVLNDVAPGTNKAILTLADGRKVNLSDADSGELARQQGIQIVKLGDGQLSYRLLATDAEGEPAYNTVEIPRGAQQLIELPDGTRVWLNAESSLRFPTSFANLDSRNVQLRGEAYFEVAKDRAHPFIVSTDGQEVRVLGTHFNINAYPGENKTRTTLLEGSVKVALHGRQSGDVVIRPNQQAISDATGLSVVQADIEQVTDWKNGDFIFKRENLSELMERVGRWYDVQVVYLHGVDTSQTFSGKVSRKKNISELIKALQATSELRFTINERKVIVSKK